MTGKDHIGILYFLFICIIVLFIFSAVIISGYLHEVPESVKEEYEQGIKEQEAKEFFRENVRDRLEIFTHVSAEGMYEGTDIRWDGVNVTEAYDTITGSWRWNLIPPGFPPDSVRIVFKH